MRLAVLPVSSSFYCLSSSIAGDGAMHQQVGGPKITAVPVKPFAVCNRSIESLGLNITTFR
jgi:hypothetical protein